MEKDLVAIRFINEIKEICKKNKENGLKINEARKIGVEKYGLSKKRIRRAINNSDLITCEFNLIFFKHEDYLKYENKYLNNYNPKNLIKNKNNYEHLNNVPIKSDFDNCCYRFLNNKKQIIYIGRASNLLDRMKTHKHLPKECYDEIDKIEYTKFKTEDDLDIAERYYIAKYKPKYNEEFKNKNFTFDIDYLDYKYWGALKDIYGLNVIRKHNK